MNDAMLREIYWEQRYGEILAEGAQDRLTTEFTQQLAIERSAAKAEAAKNKSLIGRLRVRLAF